MHYQHLPCLPFPPPWVVCPPSQPPICRTSTSPHHRALAAPLGFPPSPHQVCIPHTTQHSPQYLGSSPGTLDIKPCFKQQHQPHQPLRQPNQVNPSMWRQQSKQP